MTYPASAEGLPFTVNYRYSDDAYHRLSSVPGYLEEVSYDLNGRVTQLSFANGVSETVARDELGRPREQVIVDTSDPAGSVNRFLETYLWSERGNLVHKATERLAAGGASQGVTLEALSYDLNDRLTVADAGTAGVERFAYDGAGNRLNDPAGYPVDPAFNGYDSCNRLIRQGPATGQHVELSYVDPSGRSRGNIVSRTLVDGAGQPLAVQATYSWTQDNLLTGVARPGFSAVSYRYDAEGARVTRQAGGLTTKYLFMGLEPLLERRSDGSADYYVYALGRQVGRVTTNGIGGQETVFFHADYLKSVRAVTDVTGAVVWSERYKAFGSPAELAGGTANPYRFTGKCWDEEAGLFYFQARWMDPAIGRFLSEDPLWGNIRDPQSLNRFAYGRNNPFVFNDPTGQDFVDVNETAESNSTDLTGAYSVTETIDAGNNPAPAQPGILGAGKKGNEDQKNEKEREVNAKITHYDNCEKCCGKNPDDPDYGKCADGTNAGKGTVAADKSVPFGAKVSFTDPAGNKFEGTVHDRGGAIKGDKFDVWCESHKEALEKGVFEAIVTITLPQEAK